MNLEQARDVVIVVYGVVGVLLFAVLIAVALILLVTVRGLARTVRDLIEDPVKPAIGDVRATIQDVKGTTEFLADRAVHPVIRVVGVLSGVKRGFSVAAGLGRRRR
jgi:hypothetical protein